MLWGPTSTPHIGDLFYLWFHLSWLGMALFGPKLVKHGRGVNVPKWSKRVQKWPPLDQNWPNMAGLSTYQSGPKGSKRGQKGPKWLTQVFLTIRDHFGPIWTLLDHFKQKWIFLLSSISTKPYFVHLRQKNRFCLNWTKRVQTGGPLSVPFLFCTSGKG